MQELGRLINLIDYGSPKLLPMIDPEDHESLEGKLYHLLKLNPIIADEEACQILYGERQVISSFRMLKSRVRKKLLNNLLFIELPERHVRVNKKLLIECQTLLLQANKLLALDESVLADKLVDQVISLAQKAELNDVLAKAYEIKQQKDLTSQDRGRFEKNLKLMQHYHLIDSKEKEALVLFNQLKFEVSMNISNMRKQGSSYLNLLMKLRELWESTGSSNIYNSYYLMNMGFQEIVGNYEQILENIAEAETLLSNKKLNPFWFNHHFTIFIKVYACLRLQKIDEGLRIASVYLDSYKEGSSNWFAFLENYLMLSLHKRDLALAVTLSERAFENHVLSFPLPGIKERWALFFRFLRIAAPELISEKLSEATLDDFETSIISRDKEGLNLPLMIVQYLERLPDLDDEELELYVTRFDKYALKYLKGHAAVRARLFLKLLGLSMKEDARNLKKKGASTLKKLQNTPLTRDPIAEVEIIPYEHLWEVVQERALLRLAR